MWFVRGNDGLTSRQRAAHAKRYAEGAGKTPTAAEMAHYRWLGGVARGRQCAAYGCAQLGTGFTDEQLWLCDEHVGEHRP